MANTYIAIANSLGDTFSNALENDLIFYASEPARLMLGTQSNLPAQLQIGSNNIIFNELVTFSSNVKVDGSVLVDSNISGKGSILFNSNLMVLGPVTLCNDVQILGTLSTGKGVLLNGDQIVSGGASYCNGDIYFINFNSNGFIDQRVFLRSYFGNPTIYLNQVQDPANQPVKLFQTSNSEGFITNNNHLNLFSHSNIHFGNSNNIYVTLSNTGYLGVGMSNPKAKVDVYDGNVNADNVIKLRKSTDSTGALNININWQNIVTGNQHCVFFETTQQLNGQLKQGTRIQKHKLVLTSPFTLTSYVANGYGDMEAYSSLYVNSSNSSTSNIRIQSFTSNVSIGAGNIKHDLDVNVFVASTGMGHLWLS